MSLLCPQAKPSGEPGNADAATPSTTPVTADAATAGDAAPGTATTAEASAETAVPEATGAEAAAEPAPVQYTPGCILRFEYEEGAAEGVDFAGVRDSFGGREANIKFVDYKTVSNCILHLHCACWAWSDATVVQPEGV